MKNLRKQKINMLLTAIIICISVVAVGVVYTPKILKMDMKVVETGSMSPTIKPYSLIYIKPYDNFEDYRVGDIVTFTDNYQQKSFTHRIVEIDEQTQSFVTKGDANNTEDPAVGEDAVFGLYKGRIPGLGDFAMFLQKPLGMAVFIGIPVCAFIIYDIIRRQRSSGRKDKETEELKAELERLRAAAGEKNPEKEDGGKT